LIAIHPPSFWNHSGVFLQVVWWLVGRGRTYVRTRRLERSFVPRVRPQSLLFWLRERTFFTSYRCLTRSVLQLAGAVREVCTLELDTASQHGPNSMPTSDRDKLMYICCTVLYFIAEKDSFDILIFIICIKRI
jgi:hypothetical protein